jgi:lipoyltransferase/lipoate-protein ligase
MNARIIVNEKINDSYMKMALDEAIALSVSEKKSLPTLRFYTWKKPAVAIGFFQEIKSVVNLKNCKKDDVEIFRRLTGGGAVYKYPKGELNYSFIIPEKEIKEKEITKSYEKIGNAIIKGLKKIGIECRLAGINDILFNNKKISGNAQTRINNTILQHGTILLDFDIDSMIKYLKISKEKIKDKEIKNIKDRVGTIKEIFPSYKLKDIENAIIDGFRKEFKLSLRCGKVTSYEKKLAEKLYLKYSSREWIYQR